MNDPRRFKVPWHSWRCRLGLLLPTALFALLTLNSLQDLPTHPFPSLLFATFFFAFTLLRSRNQ